ncbi:MAG: hypothetical protein KBA26_01345 [Candidatus Delongbacteria bacterium]|nr:hypothetical protein [Candidatus Delongbacteria bacterium]
MKTDPSRSLNRVILISIGLFLVPLLLFTFFQMSERQKEEALLQSVYQKQFAGILFSINQYCWDYSKMIFFTIPEEIKSNAISQGRVQEWLQSRPEIEFLILHPRNESPRVYMPDSVTLAKKRLFEDTTYLSVYGNTIPPLDTQPISDPSKISLHYLKIVHYYHDQYSSMMEDAGENYLRPVSIPWDTLSDRGKNCLLFQVSHQLTGAVVIDNHRFINTILRRNLTSIDTAAFVYGLRLRTNPGTIYTSTENRNQVYELQEKFWILPEWELVIGLKGASIQQIIRQKIWLSMVFLVVVGLTLSVGLFYLIYNMRRERMLAQMKTDFVANVSHELRTPLALIRMYAEMMLMGRAITPEKSQHYHQVILNESIRLTQLINNILNFSKIESRQRTYHMQPAQLEPLLREILDMYQFHLEQKGFTLELSIQPGLPEIELDREAVTQAIINLLDNAVKFSGESRRIDISLQASGFGQELAIRDYGIGIPAGEQHKIFEKFYRVENSLTQSTKGTGLGLSLVRHIMDAHGGTIGLVSRAGQGSTFSLNFKSGGV